MFKDLTKMNSYIHVGMACTLAVGVVAFGSAWFWDKPVESEHQVSDTKGVLTKSQEVELNVFLKEGTASIKGTKWQNYEVNGDCFLSKLDHNNDGFVNGEDLQYLYDNVRIKGGQCGEGKLCTYRGPKETCTDEYTTNDSRNFYIFLRGWSSIETIQQQAAQCGDVECKQECVEPDINILLDMDGDGQSDLVDAFLVTAAILCADDEDKNTCFSQVIQNANRSVNTNSEEFNDTDNDGILDDIDTDRDNDGIVNSEDSDYSYDATCADGRCDITCDGEVSLLDAVLMSQYVNSNLTEEEIIERFVDQGCFEFCEEQSICGDGIVNGTESCDRGSRCSDLTECTGNPEVCKEGASDCNVIGRGSYYLDGNPGSCSPECVWYPAGQN